MNKGKKINFRQERDFSELFRASYLFIRQEFRVLSKPLLLYIAPFLLALSFGFLFMPEIKVPAFMPDIYPMITFSLGYFIVQLTIYASIKEYVENSGHIRLSRVKDNILAAIIPASIWSIIGSVILITGICLFIIPGVYFWVGTLLAFPAMFFTTEKEKMNLKRCFRLVRGRWWFTVALVVVFSALVYIVQALLLVPYRLGLYYIANSLNMDAPVILRNILLTYKIIISNLVILLNAFLAVLLSFHYFSQVEKVEKN